MSRCKTQCNTIHRVRHRLLCKCKWEMCLFCLSLSHPSLPSRHQREPTFLHTSCPISPGSRPAPTMIQLKPQRGTISSETHKSSGTIDAEFSSARLTENLFQHGLTTQQETNQSVNQWTPALGTREYHMERNGEYICCLAICIAPIHPSQTTDQLHALHVGSKLRSSLQRSNLLP